MTQALVSGLLLGGVYGLFSMGFSLAFGVMRIVNFAHGEMVMIAMYLGLFAFSGLGIDPLFMVILAPVALAALGAVVYMGVYRRFVGRATLQQLLAAIAIALILQSLAQLAFSPETRALRNAWGSQYLLLGSVFVSYAQVTAFCIAVVCVGMVELLLHRTRWGHMIRAVADDAEAAEIVGQDAQKVNLGAFGLATGLAGVAGAVLVTYYPVNPVVGFSLMPVALIATVLGGLGSVSGSLIAAYAVGYLETLTAYLIDPSLRAIPSLLLLVVVVYVRPQGLLGRR